MANNNTPVVMSIAGSDSGGGAGIQADLKTFTALNTFGLTAITSITAQNSLGVHGIYDIPIEGVAKQIEVLLSDFPVKAIKTGMLSSPRIIETVASHLRDKKLDIVIDPVLASMHGDSLIQKEALSTLTDQLFPLATVITPNLPEAEKLSGIQITDEETLRKAAIKLKSLGPKNVLITGGHHWDKNKSTDYLWTGKIMVAINTDKIDTDNTHGSGCTLSSAIAAYLAIGKPVSEAVELAKNFVLLAIQKGIKAGKGVGTLRQFQGSTNQ